jgi:hypothetical protein
MGTNTSDDARKWNGLTNEIQRFLKPTLSNEGHVTLGMNTARADTGAWRLPHFIDSRAPRLEAIHQVYGLALGSRQHHGADLNAITASGTFVQIDITRMLLQLYL